MKKSSRKMLELVRSMSTTRGWRSWVAKSWIRLGWCLWFEHGETKSKNLRVTCDDIPNSSMMELSSKVIYFLLRHLWFGHDKGEFDRLWFSHGEAFDSAMTKPSKKNLGFGCDDVSDSTMTSKSVRFNRSEAFELATAMPVIRSWRTRVEKSWS